MINTNDATKLLPSPKSLPKKRTNCKVKGCTRQIQPIFLDIVVDVTKINIQIDMPKSEPQLKKNLLRTMTGSTIKKKTKKEFGF
jgi:hypothetical protein